MSRTNPIIKRIQDRIDEIGTLTLNHQRAIDLLGTEKQGLLDLLTEPSTVEPVPKRGRKKKEKPPADPTQSVRGATLPSAPPAGADPALTKPESGLYTCTNCGWTGDKLSRDGKCPKCKAVPVATADLAEKE